MISSKEILKSRKVNKTSITIIIVFFFLTSPCLPLLYMLPFSKIYKINTFLLSWHGVLSERVTYIMQHIFMYKILLHVWTLLVLKANTLEVRIVDTIYRSSFGVLAPFTPPLQVSKQWPFLLSWAGVPLLIDETSLVLNVTTLSRLCLSYLPILSTNSLHSIRFDSIRFDSIQYIRFNSTQFNSTQFNSIPLAINKGYP